MNFIDISSWQGDAGLNLHDVKDSIDAVIVKATEGNYYVNPYCDSYIYQAGKDNLKWGFYHYAKDGNPKDEADFFISNCWNYFKNGIPCLDWEEGQPAEWVNEFVKRVYEKTKVWCWIYSWPRSFANGDVNQNCGRWICSWPSHLLNPDFNCDEGETPACNGLVCAWQFASDGRIPGYSENLDMNRFYGDEKAWDAYALGDNLIPSKPNNGENVIFENEWIKVIQK